MWCYCCIAPGTPYEVVVVALTCTGKGKENRTVFFSQELPPTKSPENVVLNKLNSTALNVTWTPLTLFEARGFPEYRVVLTAVTNRRRKRQSDPIIIITSNSFAVFSGLEENTNYLAVVGVRTGTNTGETSLLFILASS